MAKKHWATFR